MKLEIPENCTSLLFDLGGVLLDIHLQKTNEAFLAIGFQGFEKHFDSYSGSPFIETLEEGKMTNEEFIAIAKTYCNEGTTDEQIIIAWNALIGIFPKEKFELLQQLKKKYKIFLYSNTNAIHVAYLNNYYNTTFGENIIQNCFTKIYYSHILQIRKPNAAGFLQIMKEQNVRPQEIFYIDDGAMHISTAKDLCIQTQLWKQNDVMEM
jgi:glucose-1-phosphatase